MIMVKTSIGDVNLWGMLGWKLVWNFFMGLNEFSLLKSS